MNKIVWSDDFTVGIKEIDAQHKKITEVLNVLVEQPSLCSGTETVGTTLNLLSSLFSSHFVLEEHHMKNSEHEGFDEHKLEHDQCNARIDDLCAAVKANEDDKAQALLGNFCSWWENHMREEYFGYQDNKPEQT